MPRRARPAASDQLPRQWSLMKLLERSKVGLTVRELSDQLHTSKSNVERDLASLRRAGFPLEAKPDPQHTQRLRWRLPEGKGRDGAPGFGPAELLALHAAAGMLEFLSNTPIHMDLQHVLSKVRAGMAQSQAKAVTEAANVFTSHLRDYVSYDGEDRRAILDDLMDAVARSRKCRVQYQGADAAVPKVYTACPLRLFGHHNALYALVKLDGRDGVRTLAVHRILELEVLDEGFSRPRLDLDAHTRHAFGVFIEEPQEVEVHFQPEVARYVMERTFHPLEQKKRLPDGSVHYRVAAGGQNEVVAWVLGFGGAAELIKPESWRTLVRQRAESMSRTHTQGR